MNSVVETMLALQERIQDADLKEREIPSRSYVYHSLKLRYMGMRDGIQYALNAQGLEFVFTDVDGREGTIQPYSFGIRGKYFDEGCLRA